MSQTTQKLRLNALIDLVVASMIGGGIFSLPQNMAEKADAGAILIGWAITAVGMLTLAFVFQTLNPCGSGFAREGGVSGNIDVG
jgi:arginine:ornithine antiporter / lysine permease